MSKELTKKPASEVALANEYHKLMPVNDHLDPNDIILPKILVMQGLSKLVADGKAVLGEIRESLDGKLLAEREKPLEFIPFHYYKTWICFLEEKGKLQYKKQVPFTAENANWEWEGTTKEGVKFRNDATLNFYCLLPDEIKSGMFLPYLLSFRRTSYKAGKTLVTQKEKLKMFKRPLASMTFNLVGQKTENDLGKFYKFEITPGRNTTKEELEAVMPWFDMAQSTVLKVDESDLAEEATTDAQPDFDC